MKKIVAVVAGTAAAGLLFAGAASPASAETVNRNGAKKVTITAQGAPAGAVVTKAKVTVKKGKKTVARNKNFYKAKKGTYKVTSTVSYYLPAYDVQLPSTQVQGESTEVQGPSITKTVPVLESDMHSEKCTVTGRSVANRTVQAVDFYDAYEMSDWATVRGQAAIAYTGNCTATFYDEDVNAHPVAWADDWTEIVSVGEMVDMTRAEFDAFNAQAWLENELAKNSNVLSPSFVGDVVLYPGDGTELDKAGSITVTLPGEWTTVAGQWTTVPGEWVTVPATPVTTVKNVRTVVVR